jgi:hypothetical protein
MNALNGFLGSRSGLVVTLVMAALGVYLLATHAGHALAALPYLLLLACPLIHLFGPAIIPVTNRRQADSLNLVDSST